MTTLLVVEDDQDVRTVLSDILEEEHFVVVTANDGKIALDLLTSGVLMPDIILLDLMMPTMDGSEFLRVRKEVPALASIPVIVVTAATSLEARSMLGRHNEDEAIMLLTKPFHMSQLLRALRIIERDSCPPASLETVVEAE